MPRGRHRFSSPMRALLPPASFATVAFGCAAGAWLVPDGSAGAVRVLGTGAAAAAVAAAALMRVRDRRAALQLTEAGGARARAERQHEEQLSELKADLEEARRIRGELEKRLGARHVDLARLRTDHAALLARYANAEADKAEALEGRRQLAIESSAPAKALPPGGQKDQPRPPSPANYLRASVALDNLSGNAARQGHGQSHEQAPGDGEGGFSYFVRPKQQHPKPPGPRAGRTTAQAAGGAAAEKADAASAGADAAAQGTHTAQAAAEGQDLADVVGPEVLAEAEAEAEKEKDAEADGDEDGPEDEDDEDSGGHRASGRVANLGQAS